MSSVAIHVEGLSKQYRIGTLQQRRENFREMLTRKFRESFRRFGKESCESAKPPRVWALQDVSFKVKCREIVGVIGRNGAGKSTLLKILSRITEPTRGRGVIRGRVSSLLEIGTGFHRDLTGRENIYLSGTILGMKRWEIQKKFDEIVSFAEVEKFIDTPVKFYSSGMYVRLAFAVVAHLDQEILLLDEVLALGDYDFQKKCLGKMDSVSKKGRTVLLISHNMTIISNLCNRSILLENGRLIMDGNTGDVVQKYLMSSLHGKGSQIVWEEPHAAPGNDRVRLHLVQILSANGECRGDFDINQEIVIRIVYWNLAERGRINIAIWLKDELGNVVLSSGNLPSENLVVDTWFDRSRPVGLFETSCRIPGNLLNVKTYVVDVMSSGGFSSGLDFHAENVTSFKVSDIGTRNVYNVYWPGGVRPKLAWSTTYLGLPNALHQSFQAPLSQK